MNYSTLEITRSGQVATVWMNRPELHNAMNEHLIADLTAAFRELNRDDAVRVIVLAGHGKSFSAGADLDWMRRAAGYTEAQNLEDANKLAAMLKGIYRSKKPVIARIHGAALAGGTGLTAVCDIAVATDAARFALTEVRLGLIPATIGPYVADAIGWRQARRYFLSAEHIDAATALRIGLVEEVVSQGAARDAALALAEKVGRQSPCSVTACKTLVQAARHAPPAANLIHERELFIKLFDTQDQREGVQAFLEKRVPQWKNA